MRVSFCGFYWSWLGTATKPNQRWHQASKKSQLWSTNIWTFSIYQQDPIYKNTNTNKNNMMTLVTMTTMTTMMIMTIMITILSSPGWPSWPWWPSCPTFLCTTFNFWSDNLQPPVAYSNCPYLKSKVHLLFVAPWFWLWLSTATQDPSVRLSNHHWHCLFFIS